MPLQPGINTVGRAEGNHQVIPHSSISSRHCEIIVGEKDVLVRDLGSTNGTFIDEQPVQESPVAHGQRLRMGHLEFILDAPELLNRGKAGPLRVSVATVTPVAPVEAPVGQTAAQAIAALAPTLEDEPGFYEQIPSAFVYPFRGNGIWMLGIGTVVFSGMEVLSNLTRTILGFMVSVGITGYLFAYMQRIISHSAQGDEEMPDFPDFSDWWSDIVRPFLIFMAAILMSSVPTLIAAYYIGKDESFMPLIYPALALTALYFPMALLAVGITDSFVAVSPHVVVPSIVRVFVPYLLTFLLLAFLFGIRIAGGMGIEEIPSEWLPLRIVVTFVMGFVSLYLMAVEMRLLGLLFRSYRPQLGWV
jgi:hypothetical protein